MIDITKLHLGMTRDEVKQLFGEPPIWGGVSRKYRTPCVYRYGRIELGFGPYKNSGPSYVMDIGENGEDHTMLMTDNPKGKE